MTSNLINRQSESFDWGALVPHTISPVKLAVIEAMAWIGLPVSAVQLEQVLDEKVTNSAISYHLKTLCDQGVLEIVEVRPIRGTGEKLCFFTESAQSRRAA
jgi:hypothetical protein